jgi:hypothetical protein
LNSGLKSADTLHTLHRLIITVITLSTGLIILLSFVFDNEMLLGLRAVFVEWTVIVLAFAIILGVLNVLRVHAQRIQKGQGAGYSIILVLAFLAVFVPGILAADNPEGLVGPTGAVVDFAYRYVQRPLQATLFSLMAFFVATAAWRAFRVRSAASLVMLIAAVLVLLGSIKFGLDSKRWELVTQTRNWVMHVPAMAGARGILIGIALGTVVTGLRLLLGMDRPYSD